MFRTNPIEQIMVIIVRQIRQKPSFFQKNSVSLWDVYPIIF
ncbi:Uncharacterized protein dnm_032740 [Desulfonema magnum]|uniref:Transposase n=1 Tax=Desulfonema magnum TaxID=45655 RepID=A0A975BK84_9BACT|nr:Uncharacterized protein dnm_032740 [Desulfonema magnum]